VLVIAILKGAFGGGFALLGIPLLGLAMDPLQAGALLAPLFLVMDLFAFRYWTPDTWSRAELKVVLPTLPLGVAVGALLIAMLPKHWVAILMAVVTLAFAARWFAVRWHAAGRRAPPQPHSARRGLTAGFLSGITTMLAHSGGPPIAMYLLPLQLPKAIYAGTTTVFFFVANICKVGPWLLVARPGAETWWLTGFCALVCPLGVWLGWVMHRRLDEQRLYLWCYLLLVATGCKLLWDGLTG
jgi:uncharacterized membrane protein YfcA